MKTICEKCGYELEISAGDAAVSLRCPMCRWKLPARQPLAETADSTVEPVEQVDADAALDESTADSETPRERRPRRGRIFSKRNLLIAAYALCVIALFASFPVMKFRQAGAAQERRERAFRAAEDWLQAGGLPEFESVYRALQQCLADRRVADVAKLEDFSARVLDRRDLLLSEAKLNEAQRMLASGSTSVARQLVLEYLIQGIGGRMALARQLLEQTENRGAALRNDPELISS